MAKFVTGRDLTAAIHRVLASKKVRCAVAFWGAGAENSFGLGVESARILCNLRAGGTNPAPLKTLLGRTGFTIRQCDRLHAKVYIGDDTAIVASANCSTNGMGIEGDPAHGWIEGGVVLDQIDDVVNWFDELWADTNLTRPVTRRALNQVPLPRGTSSPHEEPRSYVVIWTDDYSPAGEAAFEALVEESGNSRIGAYEDWPQLPQGALLYDFHNGPNGVSYTGCWRTFAPHYRFRKEGRGAIYACEKVRGNAFDVQLRSLARGRSQAWQNLQELIATKHVDFYAIEPNFESLEETLGT